MLNTFKPDYIVIAFVLAASVIGILKVIKNYHDTKHTDALRLSAVLIFSGLLFVFFSVIANSFVENRWDNGYIISFLLLCEVSKAWYFRHICAVGYIFFILGITIFLLSCKNRNTRRGIWFARLIF